MANNVKPTKTPIFAETEAELESDAFLRMKLQKCRIVRLSVLNSD
jgi:hypothetical protein